MIIGTPLLHTSESQGISHHIGQQHTCIPYTQIVTYAQWKMFG